MLDDMAAKIADRLPIFIALVVGLSIVLLMAVFRSLWVPLVIAAFNLLSIGAAYGVVVAVFQWGWGAAARRQRRGPDRLLRARCSCSRSCSG